MLPAMLFYFFKITAKNVYNYIFLSILFSGVIRLREVASKRIKEAVKKLFIDANYTLPCDIVKGIDKCRDCETAETAKKALDIIKENIDAANKLNVPICQDTGMAVVFLEIGRNVHITGGSIEIAVNEGVREAYEKGLLRKSVVADPLERINTNDNTPAVIHYEITEGENVKITALPKGFGSENMSALKMLIPADGKKGVVDFVINTVKNAGSRPCPPIVVGVGIGGTFEQCAILAKKALCRPIDSSNINDNYKNLEDELLEKINNLNIGAQGFGGKQTALGVNVEYAPTHIAGLPVAVNISCHVTRHKSVIL